MMLPPMTPRLQKVPCQPNVLSNTLTRGASPAPPSPPAAHRMPVARPKRRRNQPLTAAMRGTMQMDWVSDSSTLKVRRKCQGCRTGSAIHVMLPLRHSSRHVVVADEEFDGSDMIRQLLGKRQRLAHK